MIDSKYVVIKQRLGVDTKGRFIDKEIIFVFPNEIIHRDFAMNNHGTSSRMRGAGFIGRDKNGTHFCYGRSDSLSVDSRPEDTILLKNLLGE
jgi:hypothetical protein